MPFCPSFSEGSPTRPAMATRLRDVAGDPHPGDRASGLTIGANGATPRAPCAKRLSAAFVVKKRVSRTSVRRMREIQNGPENDRRSVIPRERLPRRVAIGLAALIAIVVALASCSTETVTDVAPGTDASAPTDDDGSIDPFGPEGGAADSSAGSHHDASDGAQPTGTCGSSCNGCCNGNTCVAACPTGLVCDTHNHVCVPPPCSATNPCAAGCCAGGVCETGTASTAPVPTRS